ncbi:MAG: spore coat protein [Peptococcaceae bacterium]|nr:spore coat protein [Peptococcaceae bacterium]
MQLSQKERMLLEDLQSHEQIVVQKCSEYAQQAQDPQLKQLFQNMVQHEQQHIKRLNQTLNQVYGQQQGGQAEQKDAMLCQDMLSSEKYLSSVYNTAIFEMQDTSIRQELNAIQSDKQKFGEEIYKYMQSKGMYQ